MSHSRLINKEKQINKFNAGLRQGSELLSIDWNVDFVSRHVGFVISAHPRLYEFMAEATLEATLVLLTAITLTKVVLPEKKVNKL